MKKILAVLLVVLLLAPMVMSCNNSGNKNQNPPASPPSSQPADTPPAGGSPPASGGSKTLGWWPDALEASKNREKYTIAYVSIAMSDQLHSGVNEKLKEWASKLNCDFVSYDANADRDALQSGIETYAAQGLDGLVLDVDVSSQPPARATMDEYGTPWFPAMSPFMNNDNTLYTAPAAILDGYTCGRLQVDWMFDNYQSQLGVAAVDPSRIGYIFLDWSPHPDIHRRIVGATERYTELYPKLVDSNWIGIDVLPGGPANSEGAFNLVSAYLATNGDKFDYWFIGSSTDEFAIGATRAVEQIGIDKRVMISAIMGDSIISEWNAGKTSAWKSIITVPIVALTEPMICSLLAIIDGRATFDTLLRDYVPAGQSFGIYEFAPQIFTFENKDEYFNSVDAWLAHKYP